MQKDIKASNSLKLIGGLAFGYGIYKGMKAKKENKQISTTDTLILVAGMFTLLVGFVGINKA
jgi:hypothetical protein